MQTIASMAFDWYLNCRHLAMFDWFILNHQLSLGIELLEIMFVLLLPTWPVGPWLQHTVPASHCFPTLPVLAGWMLPTDSRNMTSVKLTSNVNCCAKVLKCFIYFQCEFCRKYWFNKSCSIKSKQNHFKVSNITFPKEKKKCVVYKKEKKKQAQNTPSL